MEEEHPRLVDRTLAWAALAYLALAVAWSAPASLAPARTVPDLGDPLHLAWVMAWDAHELAREPGALFEANAFHPHPRSLTFSDHLLPEALLVAPVFWITGNAVLASNLAVIAALTLSALSMNLLLRGLTASRSAAFLAGLAYAFTSFTQHERLRVHVLNLQWWPLALLFLLRFARAGRARDAAGLAACLALQGLSGTYYLAYTALLAPLWFITAYAGWRRWPTRAEVGRLALAGALALLAVAPILWPYWAQFHGLGLEKSWTGGADALTYLEPAPSAWLWRGLDLPGAPPELPHFLGVVTLALALCGAAGAWSGRGGRAGRAAGLLALATGIVAFALSLGPIVHVGGHRLGTGVYEWLYRLVPLSRGMASPERVGVLVGLSAALLAGLGAAALLGRVSPRLRLVTVAVLAVLLPLEHWSPPRAAAPVPVGSAVPAVYRWLAAGHDGGGAVAELPLHPERSKRLWATYLYFSTYHWRPVPIGRASFYPPGHDLLAWHLRGFPDETSLALLDRLSIHTVVVHPLLWSADERRERLAAIEAQPRLALVQRFEDILPAEHAALGLGEERVYRLGPGPAPVPPCVPADEIPRQGWRFAGSGVNKPERTLDGDRRTAWFTARPQHSGDYLEVELARPETVAAIALEAGYPYDEFPRNLVLLLRGPEGPPARVPWDDGPEERWAQLDELVHHPAQARLVLRFAPQVASAARLMVGWREDDPAWPRWSVPELRLYRACRPPRLSGGA
jgi:hypothetical protein